MRSEGLDAVPCFFDIPQCFQYGSCRLEMLFYGFAFKQNSVISRVIGEDCHQPS